MESLDVHKGTGRMTGAAWIGWDGTYSFDANGTQDPGRVARHADLPAGAALGDPRLHRERRRVRSTTRATTSRRRSPISSSRTKGIGQVSGTLSLRGDMLTLSELNAQSRRLSVTGQGRLALDAGARRRSHAALLRHLARSRTSASSPVSRRSTRSSPTAPSARAASSPTSITSSSRRRSTSCS